MYMLATGCPHVSLNWRVLSPLELLKLIKFLALALIKSHLKWYICVDHDAQSDILANILGCWSGIQCPESLFLSQASHLLSCSCLISGNSVNEFSRWLESPYPEHSSKPRICAKPQMFMNSVTHLQINTGTDEQNQCLQMNVSINYNDKQLYYESPWLFRASF